MVFIYTRLKKKNAYIEMTRLLLQLIPSQLLPQGSAPAQFGGTLRHMSFRAFRATTVSQMQITKDCT